MEESEDPAVVDDFDTEEDVFAAEKSQGRRRKPWKIGQNMGAVGLGASVMPKNFRMDATAFPLSFAVGHLLCMSPSSLLRKCHADFH